MATSDSSTGRLPSRVRHQEVVAELDQRDPPDDTITCAGRQTPRISVFADKCGQEWTISVRDRGIGIDPADADRIFQVFNRLHSSEEYDGTGIERTLRRCIVERYDAETATGTTTDHE